MKRFTTLFVVLALIVLATAGAFAQSMSNYAFVASSGTYTPITGSTDLVAANATNDDDTYSAVVPLTFNFVMNGVKYTHFIANVNGFIRLGQNSSVSGSNPTTLSSSFTNAIGNVANTQMICPMWDDNYKLGNTSDKVHYTLTGGVGTHVLTVEWFNIKRVGSGGGAQNFQLQLIEATGQIVFVYGTCAAPVSATASVGFTDNVGGSTHFVSITDPSTAPKNLTTSATASTTTAQDAIDGTATVSGLTYTFTPPFTSPAAPTTISFTNVGRTGVTVGWTDNSATEVAFTVYRATALVGPYSLVATVPSTSVGTTGTTYSINQTGLSATTTYYYNINAIDEGSASADLSGSTTTAAGPSTPFSGAYTINLNGADAGTNYISFAEAFQFLNALGVSGPTTFTVTGTAATVVYPEGNLTLGGTYISGVPQSALLTSLSATNTLTFVNDAGKTINMSGVGVSTTIDYVFRLMGVDYVTFDGINIVDVGANITTTFEFGYVIQNSVNDGATNNTIKNMNIAMVKNGASAGTLTYGVAVGNGTTLLSFGTAGTYASRNNNNKIQNFTISGVRRGVVFNGLAIPSNDVGNEVSGPAFTSATGGVWVGGSRVTSFGGSSSGTDYGVGLDGQKDMKVFNVQVDSCTGFGASTATVGIHVGFNAAGTAGADNIEIYNNVIHNIQNNFSLNAGVTGIRATGATLNILKIYNNLIYDLRAPLANAANVVAGLNINGPTAGSKIEVYNNSISLTSAAAAASIWKGINAFGTAGVVFVVKNNAFNITGGDSSRIYEFAASTPNLLDFSNNVMNVGTPTARRRMVATWGATTASNSRTTLLDWQSTQATPSDGVDQRSAYGDPGFASATDLTYGGANTVNNVGVPISGLSTANDILGVPRSGSTPDAGAFEGDFSAGFVDAAGAGIAITPLEIGTVASEVRVVITDNVTPSVTARLWYRLASTAPAGAYSVFGPDLAPSDSGNGVYRWGTSLRTLAAGTYQYYIVVRDLAGNSYADPTMTPGATSPGFTAAGDPNWNGANPFLSAGVRLFQNAGATLAAGTYSVGPTGLYPTLTAAATDMNTKPLTGNVIFELQAGYTGAGEATQITFNQPSYTVAGPVTVTIRPEAATSTMLLTAGNPGAQNSFIVLDGARDLIFDGRPGGVGSTSMWTIRNSKDSAAVNNAGEAVRLQNDALRNTFQYVTLQANTTTGLGGVINVGATFYGGKGNNLNVIDHCDIGPNTAAVTQVPPNPLRGIGAIGGGTNVYNQNNTYSNNNIHDFHSLGAGQPIGIFLAGEVGSTVTGNSIYQTVPRTGVIAATFGIAVNPSTGPGNTITNNYIGGSAPLCGGAPYTLTTTVSFTGITFSGAQFTSKTTMNGNTFANFAVSTSQTTTNGTGFAAISVAGTNQAPIDIKYNVMGNSSVNAVTSPSIAVTVTGTANTFVFGYIAGSSGICNIVGNTVGGYKLLQTSTGTCLFAGIQHQTTDVTNMDSNLVGSLTTSRNIWQGTNAQFVGISHSAGAVNASISYNTVANILDSAVTAGTSQIMFGLSGSGASPLTIVGNTVRDIIGNNHATARGLSMSNTGIGNVIRGNSFYNWAITPQTISTAVVVEGIFISSSTSAGLVDKNIVHSLVNGSTSVGSGLYGIDNQFGANWTYSNNMLSLGTGSNGDIVVRGIYDFSSPPTTGFANFYYNSIYISGSVTGGNTLHAAYFNSDGSGIGTKTYKNNIFSDTRSSTVGALRGFAFVASSSTTPAMVSNNNLFYTANDTVAQWLGTAVANYRTLAGWQAAQPGGSGGDAATKTGDAAFTSATDLHVNTAATPSSAAANIGAAVAGITTDIDGATRNVSTPDAGYDEFTLPAPAAFALTSPANAALGQPLSVTLNWTASAQYASYDLYIGVGSLPGSPTVSGLTSNSYIFAAGPSSTYFWNVVAKNADASTSSSNGAFSFTTISPPAAPSGLTATPTGPVAPQYLRIQQVQEQADAGFFKSKAEYLAAMNEARGVKPGELKLESSVSGINLSWTDNAASGGNSEDSFYVYAKLNSAPAVGGHASPDFLAAVDSSVGSGGTVLYTHAPLGLNEAWFYKVTAKNAQGESGSSSANTTTFVNAPGAPTFSDVRWNRMVVTIDINGNPGTAETYAIHETSTGNYLTATGTLTSVPEVWQTYTAWGGASGKAVTGLARGTTYTFEVKARNAANVETGFGPSGIQATTFDQPISQLAESFTGVAFPPAGWSLSDEPTVRWLRNTVSTQPNGVVGPMAEYDFFNASVGEVDTLISPAVSLTGALSASLNWSHSYRTYTSLDPDSIFVMISSDGGTTWSTLVADGYPNMATRPPSTSSLGPASAADWRANTVDIPAPYLAGSVQVAWRAKSAFGNNYWLDDITILKKVTADNITVTMNLDADALFATSGDRSPKVWHLALHTGSPSGPVVTEGDVASLTASNVLDGTYYAVASDSGMGWAHLGRVRNGTPVAGPSRIDTIVLAGGGINWTTDFVVATDNVAPVISYSLVSSTSTPGSPVLSATITDNTGVDVSAGGKPRLYYRSGASIPLSGAYTAVSGVAVSGDTSWTFAFPSLSSVTFVEYYVAAQDIAGNAVTEPSGTGYTSNPPNGVVTSANRFVVASPLTFTVGASGANFPSITEGLTWFNGGIDGPMQFLLNSDYTSTGEVYPIFIGGIPGLGSFADAIKASPMPTQGRPSAKKGSEKTTSSVNPEIRVPDEMSSVKDRMKTIAMKAKRIPGLGKTGRNSVGTNTFTIKPNTGATPGPISGTAAFSGDFTILWLDGASYVTIDGLTIANGGDGPTVFISDGASHNRILNSTLKGVQQAGNAVGIVWFTDNVLAVNCTDNSIIGCTLTDNGGLRPYGAVTFFSTAPVTDINDTVKNCIITNFGTATTSGGQGIWAIAQTTGLVIEGNDISFTSPAPGNAAASYAGMFLGSSAAGAVLNTTVRNNTIHDMDAVAASGLLAGISAGSGANIDGALVEGNTIYNLGATTSASTGVRGMYVAAGLNQTMTRNTIKDLQNTLAGGPVVGLRISGAAGGQAFKTTWTNNMITLGNVGSNGNVGYLGISDNGNTDDTAIVAFNSIYIGGVATGGTTAAYNRSAASVVTLRDNILMSERDGGSGKHYGIRSQVVSGGIFNSDNNDIYVTGATNGVFGAFAGVDQTTLGAWQTASAGDAASLNADPVFVDASLADLHIRNFIGDLSPVANAGVVYGGVTVDIDNETGKRSTTPDIGADEFNLRAPVAFTLVSPANGATAQPLSGTLSWNSSVGSTSFDAYLDVNPAPTTLLANVAGTSTPYSGLSTDLTYYWKVVAKNSDSSTTATGAPFNFATILSTVNVNVSLATGWNMISNPVIAANDSVRVLYPTSSFAFAYSFNAGYVQDYTMENGTGYWEKFPGALSQTVSGLPNTRDTLDVIVGWNMVGSISNSVDTSTIVSIPAGIRASNWYGYVAGYVPVSNLLSGQAYWIRSNAVGKFVLANPLVARPAKVEPSSSMQAVDEVLNSVRITDSRGNSQTLYFGADASNSVPVTMYTMPPMPPVGAFDARFESADGGSMVQTHAVQVADVVEMPVTMQSEAYPLTITWKVTKGIASYELTDGRGGSVFHAKEMRGEGSMKITNSSITKFSVKLVGDGSLPKEFALSQNYPNPFNPTTNIKFALPVVSRVSAEIYNVLGQHVSTLVKEELPAGYHVMEWNGTSSSGQQVGSGTYFLKLSATGANGKTFSEVRKLLMLK